MGTSASRRGRGGLSRFTWPLVALVVLLVVIVVITINNKGGPSHSEAFTQISALSFTSVVPPGLDIGPSEGLGS